MLDMCESTCGWAKCGLEYGHRGPHVSDEIGPTLLKEARRCQPVQEYDEEIYDV